MIQINAMNKSLNAINRFYGHLRNEVAELDEMIRFYLSRNLMDTSEENKYIIPENMYITLEEGYFGLSTLELPQVISLWQDPVEGIIWVCIDGSDEPIEWDDIELTDQMSIINAINFEDEILDDNNPDGDPEKPVKIYFAQDKCETQRGVQLKDGRIVSLYNENNEFYLRYDSILDLKNGIIIRDDMGELTDDDIKNGYTTLNQLIKDGLAERYEVSCVERCDCDINIGLEEYDEDPDVVNISEIIEYFSEHGFNVTVRAIMHNLAAWESDMKSGYRDEKNGYHLFTPCGCNELSFSATTLNDLCADWQTTYEY